AILIFDNTWRNRMSSRTLPLFSVSCPLPGSPGSGLFSLCGRAVSRLTRYNITMAHHRPTDESMYEKIRIGAVSYLNTKPLVYELETLAPNAELILDYPSRLADQLAAGELDVALIPVIEYFRAGTYSLVPNIAIASAGPVLSVTLFSRTPWPEIRRVALDEGSRTSAALTQV